MKHPISRRICSILILTALCGCSANEKSIFRYREVAPDKNSVVVMDAKQRAILASQTKDGVQRFCSEPSPDVFSVVAQALSAGGNFGKNADPQTIQLALTAAFSTSEQGSTIPRTQTINMLRELMFRTCERYLNGGYNNLEMSIQATRDQRLIVSILAIESLTGAVTPKPVVIGAGATASAGASGAEAAVRLDEAYKDMLAKKAAVAKRDEEYRVANSRNDKDGKARSDVCLGVRTALAQNGTLNDQQKLDEPDCTRTWSAYNDAKTSFDLAYAFYEKMLAVIGSGDVPVQTGATISQPKADGGIDHADPGSITEVSRVVDHIVAQHMQQDEFLLFCLRVLAPSSTQNREIAADAAEATKGTCIAYIKSGIKEAETLRNLNAQQAYGRATQPLFERFWASVSDGAATASKAAMEKGRKLFGDAWPSCFVAGGNRQQFLDCFSSSDVSSQDQRNFSNMEN